MASQHTKGTYSLPRHPDESARLNAQHEAFKSCIGYLLHPRILSTLPPDSTIHIADVGTGTGVWLLDLASGSPSSWQFTGFDISAEQFSGINDSVDKRCSTELLDIRDPVPEKWKGVFDVVHMRQLICGLTSKDWSLAAANAFQLLKPGGWIQWHETNAPAATYYPSVPIWPTVNCQRIFQEVVQGNQRSGKWNDDDMPLLLDRVQAIGFEKCELDRQSSDRLPETRQLITRIMKAATDNALKYLLQNDAEFTLNNMEVEELIRRSDDEIKDGKAYLRFDMYVVVGRKPDSTAR